MADIESLKSLAREVADAVQRQVRQEHAAHFSTFGQEICMGADGTVTQRIDKVAEEAALEVIGQEVNVLSEEAGFIDNGRDYTLVLDPVDGTRNAVNGIPFYCTSIAIGRERLSDVVYGLVRNLPTGDTYWAEKEQGAYLNGCPIRAHAARQVPIYILVLGDSGNETTYRMADRHNIRSLGAAALEICLVAAGAADLYLQGKDHLRVTDIAASTLILREASGEVFDARGKVLDMSLNLEERSSVLAAATPAVLEAIR
ncbi:MAG: D-fructose 1,6-bisphosphatase [Candidatus Thermoplasmatota archaeon]|nr:D-fructose 1,6-bisphosphatase [Candidatus Thermoplasmatota archaeon]